MKNIKISYAILIIALTVLWLMADTILSSDYAFFTLRHSLIYYTGIIGIGMMSVGMMLAVRPVSIEPFLGGLDKTYRLHKWLGITALVFAIAHWLWAKAPKWLVGWGWLERPARQPAPEQTVDIFRFFQSQRGLAENIGEWAFYAAVLLIVLALLKRFPYRYFFKTHRLLAIVYLLLVVHAVVLLDFSYWSEPIGPVMALLMAGGTVAAFVSLFRKVGYQRRAVGIIEELERHADNRVLRVVLKLQDRWPGHAAGQFAFVTFDQSEGPHPFTISSSWQDDGRMMFLIKGLGDYTNILPETLQVGDVVQVEGPYGRFDFSSRKPRQIWVAGGIGITPFVARLQALSDQFGSDQSGDAQQNKAIDLFYCTSAPDENFISRLRQRAEKAGVQLHLLVADKDGRLDAERLCQTVPDWPSADVWFCGPAGFGKALREGLFSKGLARDDFHQELFEMR
ncbi:MAG: ferric reductase-like transmembrane domain-containing protein [Candidatus Competibacteraceae bacterium]|nr:ferric reductase-like transmembrane domain-containing protein [Candidatus Competibacteraceae bacterium]